MYVAAQRYDAGLLAEAEFAAQHAAELRSGPPAHILDDGFQHRQLARDVDILLLNRSGFAGLAAARRQSARAVARDATRDCDRYADGGELASKRGCEIGAGRARSGVYTGGCSFRLWRVQWWRSAALRGRSSFSPALKRRDCEIAARRAFRDHHPLHGGRSEGAGRDSTCKRRKDACYHGERSGSTRRHGRNSCVGDSADHRTAAH